MSNVDNLPEIKWIKNDPKKFNCLEDGSRFLVALQVHSKLTKTTKWEFEVLTVRSDGDWLCLETGGGETYDSWNWEDFEYFQLLDGSMPTFAEEYA